MTRRHAKIGAAATVILLVVHELLNFVERIIAQHVA